MKSVKAVIYARYSSAGQTEQSIEGQLRVCKEFAERQHFDIVDEYIDRATTGTNDNRPSFQKMLADAKGKQWEVIIVYKLDRFARNKYDSVIHKHNLKKLGVRIQSATEAISDSPEGRMMESILESMAEMYSEDLSQKVRRGIKESLIKGKHIGGVAMYGYKVTADKKIEIDPEQAEIMRYIFKEYANGKPKKKIIQELIAKGMTSVNGKKLGLTSFQNNLRCRKYIGEYEHHGEIYTNIYPPIIDRVTFDKVQTMLDKYKHAPATHKSPKQEFWLTGHAICADCGGNIVGVGCTKKNDNRFYYYACSNKWRKKTCTHKEIAKANLEQAVFEKVYEHLENPETLQFIANKVIAYRAKYITNSQVKELCVTTCTVYHAYH
jgi:DNA invertase Pin-like site-specific DNA recombinase